MPETEGSTHHREAGAGPGVKLDKDKMSLRAFSFWGDDMNLYKTQKWQRQRERVLRRDEYLCRECRRYGRTTPATTVHHIYPLEQYPEWKLASWNMISLCHECHNKMHDRDNGALTALGQSWTDRVSPPTLEL